MKPMIPNYTVAMSIISIFERRYGNWTEGELAGDETADQCWSLYLLSLAYCLDADDGVRAGLHNPEGATQ